VRYAKYLQCAVYRDRGRNERVKGSAYHDGTRSHLSRAEWASFGLQSAMDGSVWTYLQRRDYRERERERQREREREREREPITRRARPAPVRYAVRAHCVIILQGEGGGRGEERRVSYERERGACSSEARGWARVSEDSMEATCTALPCVM
jgi:hypothetical protein